jgi:pimeloyl-ACP methyl ester carboxylesterase
MIRSRTCRSMQAAVAAVALVSLAVAAAPAAAQIGGLPRTGGEWLGKRPGGWTAPAAPPVAAKRRSAAPASAALTPCEEDPTFQCTTVPVPLDRRHPDGRMVNIHAEVFPHTGPGEAEGAVFVTCGGPGCSITAGPKYGFTFFVLPQIAETRDLVFVDQRGVGLSEPIDCPGLQAGAADSLYEDTAACHDQLGDAADLYSTTDVADDLDDVRGALGYSRIDLFGGSYAGADMMTYAVRHTKRVRSVVLASPAVVVGVDPFYAYAPKAMTAIAGKVCGRSPACRAANPDPERAFANVARDLRRHPVRGTGVDSAGETHDGVNVTENLLANLIMYFNGAHFTGPGEIIPAMAAARSGDAVPLLRLGADNDPAHGFGSDLREFSAGHGSVRGCVETELPFDQSARLSTRVAQFSRAYAKEPAFYGDISKPAWAHPGYLGFQPSPCITRRWEKRPLYPAGTRVKGIPTLVLGGEYDLPVPEAAAKLALRVMRGASYVGIAAAGHDPQFWSDCGPELVQRFYADKAVGDTSCASVRAGGWWIPGVFPTTVDGAPAAKQTSGAAASLRQRRLATAAAWTVMDSVQHNFFVPGDSVALRGGTVDFEPLEGGAQWTLGDARFTKDVTVNGTWTDPGTRTFDGDFTVTGPGATTTAMHIGGRFLFEGESITVTFDVGGAPASFTVPAY